jgi:sulfoxide reductase catalytic subunit YedY
MLIKTNRDGFQHPAASEITPRAVYEDRRRMLQWMATGAAGAALATWAQREALAQQVQRPG